MPKNTAVNDFNRFVFEEVLPRFNGADRERVETALRERDFAKLCEALGISQEEFMKILQRGGLMSQRISVQDMVDFLYGK